MGCGMSMEPPPLRPPGPVVLGIRDRVVDPSKYEEFRGIDFGYENLVLEGGGTKALAYCGMLIALEDIGILKNIKRYAGASMGAAIMGMLAVGGDAMFLLESFTINLNELLKDATPGARVPNLFRKKGLYPGNKIMKHFNNISQYHTGNPDTTFKQLYEETGRELCMVVSNLDLGKSEYYHVKTTPNESIPESIRKSISIPIVLQPCYNKYGNRIVDGGWFNNYPLNAFDGWHLDMSPEHSYFEMSGSEEPEFGTYNEKTLGALVFDATENEIEEGIYFKRNGFVKPERPDTKLARSKAAAVEKLTMFKYETSKQDEAFKQFISLLKESDEDKNNRITLDELQAAVGKCSPEILQPLFGDERDVGKIFRAIDDDQSGEITYDELTHYTRQRVVELQRKCEAGSNDASGLVDYVMTLVDALSLYFKKTVMKSRDHERTIGIYTDYISTTDWALAVDDKTFLVRQGWEATINFLRERKRTMIEEGKLDPNQNSVTPEGSGPQLEQSGS